MRNVYYDDILATNFSENPRSATIAWPRAITSNNNTMGKRTRAADTRAVLALNNMAISLMERGYLLGALEAFGGAVQILRLLSEGKQEQPLFDIDSMLRTTSQLVCQTVVNPAIARSFRIFTDVECADVVEAAWQGASFCCTDIAFFIRLERLPHQTEGGDWLSLHSSMVLLNFGTSHAFAAHHMETQTAAATATGCSYSILAQQHYRSGFTMLRLAQGLLQNQFYERVLRDGIVVTNDSDWTHSYYYPICILVLRGLILVTNTNSSTEVPEGDRASLTASVDQRLVAAYLEELESLSRPFLASHQLFRKETLFPHAAVA